MIRKKASENGMVNFLLFLGGSGNSLTYPRCYCRVSVGSSDANVLGSCLLCKTPFDDYSARSRCSYCRMLVLVCDSCRVCADDITSMHSEDSLYQKYTLYAYFS